MNQTIALLLIVLGFLGCGPNAWRDWPPNVAKITARM